MARRRRAEPDDSSSNRSLPLDVAGAILDDLDLAGSFYRGYGASGAWP